MYPAFFIFFYNMHALTHSLNIHLLDYKSNIGKFLYLVLAVFVILPRVLRHSLCLDLLMLKWFLLVSGTLKLPVKYFSMNICQCSSAFSSLTVQQWCYVDLLWRQWLRAVICRTLSLCSFLLSLFPLPQGFFYMETTPLLSVIYSLYQQPQAVNAILKMLCVLLMAMQRSAVICCALLSLEARDLSGCFRAAEGTCLSLT